MGARETVCSTNPTTALTRMPRGGARYGAVIGSTAWVVAERIARRTASRSPSSLSAASPGCVIVDDEPNR